MTPDMNSLIQQAQKLKEVKQLVQNGKMLEAIKLYREITNVGLKEAKDAVEAIQRGEPIQINNIVTSNIAGTTNQAEQMKDVVRLIKEGNKIEAIKKFRQIYGVGLKEAKDAIDGMDTTISYNGGTPLPSSYKPAMPSTPPIMETVSPLNGVVILILLVVVLLSGAAAFAWFVLPELRGVIMSFLK